LGARPIIVDLTLGVSKPVWGSPHAEREVYDGQIWFCCRLSERLRGRGRRDEIHDDFFTGAQNDLS
jgi:hypothetical protein